MINSVTFKPITKKTKKKKKILFKQLRSIVDLIQFTVFCVCDSPLCSGFKNGVLGHQEVLKGVSGGSGIIYQNDSTFKSKILIMWGNPGHDLICVHLRTRHSLEISGVVDLACF